MRFAGKNKYLYIKSKFGPRCYSFEISRPWAALLTFPLYFSNIYFDHPLIKTTGKIQGLFFLVCHSGLSYLVSTTIFVHNSGFSCYLLFTPASLWIRGLVKLGARPRLTQPLLELAPYKKEVRQ